MGLNRFVRRDRHRHRFGFVGFGAFGLACFEMCGVKR